MVVGYLTLALDESVNLAEAKRIVDEIARYSMNFKSIHAVKCDVGVLGEHDEQEFWREAAES